MQNEESWRTASRMQKCRWGVAVRKDRPREPAFASGLRGEPEAGGRKPDARSRKSDLRHPASDLCHAAASRDERILSALHLPGVAVGQRIFAAQHRPGPLVKMR